MRAEYLQPQTSGKTSAVEDLSSFRVNRLTVEITSILENDGVYELGMAYWQPFEHLMVMGTVEQQAKWLRLRIMRWAGAYGAGYPY